MSMKPDDIPQEVWDKAEIALYTFCNNHHLWGDLGSEKTDDLHEIIARAIMAAVEEEREACAKVCTEYRYEWKQVGDKYASLIRNRQSKDG